MPQWEIMAASQPSLALERRHLRAFRRVGHEHDEIGARVLEPEELRAHVGIVPVEALDADRLDALLAEPLGQARFVGLAPRRVLEEQARLALLERVDRVAREEAVDVVVVGGDAEDVVRESARCA